MSQEKRSFRAEVSQVLDLVIHSLYSHKEVFLRELLSNASDALDKLRFSALTSPELLQADLPLEVKLLPDREAGTLTLEDSGIGMSREELAQNLGTIAHSGSKRLVEELQRARAQGQGAPGGSDLTLIGQFGVGFYSAFLVADRVEVVSRPAQGGPAHRWVSEAKDGFTLEEASEGAPLRGTRIVLHLKESERRFADEWELRELVRRYSDFIAHPIQLRVPAKEAGLLPTFERINRGGALWQRAKSEISDTEYEEFYKHLAHDFEAPLGRTHFRVEGTQQFVGLLYVPKRAPFDLDHAHRGVRLFVKRVFVMDDCTELLPEWLRFLRGVVDSDDLPLNVSREVLQDSAIVRAIRRQLVKKSLDLLEELAKDRPADYAQLWRTFGAILKGGLHLERGAKETQERLARLLRAPSTAGATTDVLASLDEYVSRMKEGQEAIYYIVGAHADTLLRSPHIEALRARGFEVLLLTDPVDELAMEALGQFQGKRLLSALQADLSLGQKSEEEQPAAPSGLQPLIGRMRTLLQTHVSEVRASDRLTSSPVCLVVPPGGLSPYVERVLRSYGQSVPTQKRILELNPNHPLVSRLAAQAERDPAAPELAAHVELLFGQALLAEGSPLPDPSGFAERLTRLLEQTAPGA
jgi:molecular chaperone HtpG